MKIDSVHAEFMSGNAVSSTSSSHSIVSRDASGDIAVAGVSIAGNSGTLFSYSDGTRSVYGGCNASDPWFGTSSNHDLRLTTNGSERMRIDSTGNVGIGTASPLTKLNMKDGVFLAENQASTNDQILYGDGGGTGANNNSYTIANAKFGTGVFVNDTGTTGSTITLVNKEGANNTTKHASIGFVTTDTTFNGKFGGQIGFWPEDANSSKMQFRIYTSGAQAGYNLPVQRMVVNGDGNVGIGVASPGFPLDVVFSGDSGIRSKSTNSHATLNLDSGSGYGYIRFQDSGSETVWLQSKPTGDVVIRPQGGSETVVFGANGNVGIGTTSPQGALHVAGNSGSSNTSKALGVHMGVYSSAYAHIEIVCSGSNTGWIDFKNANTTGNGDHTDRIRGGSGHLEFITNQTERVRINSSGNVGIGTASPGEKLHVHENLSTSGHQIAARIGGTASSTYSTLVFGSKEGRPHIGGHKGDYGAWHDLSLQNDLMILKQSNMRVGIGTTTPDAPLHIFKAGGNAGDVGGGIKMERWDNYGCAIWSQYPSGGTVDCMAFRVANNATDAYGGTPQMVLTHEGRIGIGTTDPSSKFHVNGRIRSDQPRFFAYDTRSAINFSGGATLALNTTHYNSGSHYSTSTGYFTAPVNGVYYFHVSFFTYTTMQFAWKLVPTAGSTSYNNMRVTRNNNTGGDDVLIQTTSVSGQFSGSISLYLSTNEKFGWGSRNQSGSFYGRHSHFSGYLLSEV